MAKSANAESVSDSIRPADYRGAVQLMRTIPAKKDKVSSVNGEIADIWSKVEGKKVHKKAGKFFLSLDGLEEAERAQIARDVLKLIEASGWDTEVRDLVDMAEMASSVAAKAEGGDGRDADTQDGDEEGEAESEPAPAKKASKAASNVTPLERLRDARSKVQEQIGTGDSRH